MPIQYNSFPCNSFITIVNIHVFQCWKRYLRKYVYEGYGCFVLYSNTNSCPLVPNYRWTFAQSQEFTYVYCTVYRWICKFLIFSESPPLRRFLTVMTFKMFMLLYSKLIHTWSVFWLNWEPCYVFQNRMFHAQPLPDLELNLPPKRARSLTVQKPFNLDTDTRGAKKVAEWNRKVVL